jgi:hypothetical protein
MVMGYPATSPYKSTTTVNGRYLDVMQDRPIYGDGTDAYWMINTTYSLRPDLLANDLYGDSRLWWVFAQRNPNILKDPLFDFTDGTYIYLPPKEFLFKQLGL